MGNKGGSKHTKRTHAPGFWPIHVKEFQWTKKPSPGPHQAIACLPLSIVIREALQYAKDFRDAKRVIGQKRVKVDGKTRTSTKYPTGIMDVVEIKDAGIAIRILPKQRKGLSVQSITSEESKFKLCRIENKHSVPEGNFQLNLHDGRNILLNHDTGINSEEFKTFDTVKINLPDQKILEHLSFAEGSLILVTSGGNIGKTGRIKRIAKGSAARPPMVTIEDSEKNTFQTIAEYIFVIGKKEPLIQLGM